MKKRINQPVPLELKNLTTNKTKIHLCDNQSQLNLLKYYFQQTGNYEVLI